MFLEQQPKIYSEQLKKPVKFFRFDHSKYIHLSKKLHEMAKIPVLQKWMHIYPLPTGWVTLNQFVCRIC